MNIRFITDFCCTNPLSVLTFFAYFFVLRQKSKWGFRGKAPVVLKIKSFGNLSENHNPFLLAYWQMTQPSHFDNSPRNRFSTSNFMRSCKASIRMLSITSAVKANISNKRASLSGIPRERI